MHICMSMLSTLSLATINNSYFKRKMAPKPQNLKLSEEALQNANAIDSSAARNGRPEKVRLVIGGSAGIPALNELTLSFKNEGFGKDKKSTKLGGVAYEMQPNDKADSALDSFKVAFETPGNVPVTLIHPIPGTIDAKKLPPPDTPPQFAQVCFTLPIIRSASDVQGDNEQKWLELFEVASERRLTLELAIVQSEEVREAVEKLLGKAWDQEVAAAKKAGKEDEVNKNGVRIIFDGLASPPLNQSSSQLLRSKETEAWSDFISRLALHPRVYLKVSPLPLPSLLPAGLTNITRPVDQIASVIPVPGTDLAGGAIRTATDMATRAINAAEAATTTTSSDRRDELRNRLRVFLEPALEAFGEERLVWTSYLAAGSATTQAAAQRINGGKEDDLASLSEPEQWFEAVLTTLQDIGVSQVALDNIFSNNVSVVYRM